MTDNSKESLFNINHVIVYAMATIFFMLGAWLLSYLAQTSAPLVAGAITVIVVGPSLVIILKVADFLIQYSEK